MDTPDLVFVGGTYFTAGMERSAPGGVAVQDGTITHVGTDEEVRRLVGPATTVVDLAGGLLLPGFQDAHAHPLLAGVGLLRCDLHEATSAQDCLERVAAYAAAHPDEEWILGGGWSMEFFEGGTPTRQALDAVVADRPVCLTNRDGHGVWVNTRALTLAGLDASTPDPGDGRIEREPDGSPAGTLHEGAAGLVHRLTGDLSVELQHRGLLAAQERLVALGITAWQDAAVGAIHGSSDLFEVYVAAAASGELKARVVGALWWDRERGDEQIPELLEQRAAGTVGRFSAGSVKIMQDGVAENFTAGMLEPYLDGHGCPTDNRGLSFVDPDALAGYVTRLDAEGFQVHFHALGDRAVREALDALEAAVAANGPNDNRHHLAHLQVVQPDDVKRFAQLGASANIQALWAAHEPQMDELTIPFLGEARAAWQYPFGDLLRAGTHLAAGSDWPVSSPDPLEGIHVAVNRRVPGAHDQPPFYPENAITLAEALRAYTAGTAYVNHLDHVTGHLKPGYAADLVALDRDPFAHPSEEIADARVVRTYIAGELVHSAQPITQLATQPAARPSTAAGGTP